MSQISKHIIFENQPCKSCNSNIHRHSATLSIKYLRNWPPVRNRKGNWLLLIISGYDIGKWFQADQAIVTPTPVCTRPLPQHKHTHTLPVCNTCTQQLRRLTFELFPPSASKADGGGHGGNGHDGLSPSHQAICVLCLPLLRQRGEGRGGEGRDEWRMW